jgi:hypothetical protein
MTGQVIEVPLAEGGTVLVEVDDLYDAPVVRGGGRGGGLAMPPMTEPLEHVLAGLGPATKAVLNQLQGLADSPGEIHVEFAIKLTTDARIIIAKAGAEANFKVSLKWTRDGETAP